MNRANKMNKKIVMLTDKFFLMFIFLNFYVLKDALKNLL